MKTDELIGLLAQDAQPVAPHAIEQRFAWASLAGLACALVLMLALFGLRPSLAQDMALPMFWGKLVFAGLLAAGGLAVLRRLARPGMGLGHSLALLALPPLVLWGLAAVALGLPALAASLWALRGAAPTRLAWAGAGAGLLAGALGALAYALHCPEMAAPFLAVWYLAGMALPTLAGAWLGPRVLRW